MEKKHSTQRLGIYCKDRTKIEIDCYTLGPFLIKGNYANGEFNVPFVTAELPLIPTINRGRSAAYLAGGIETKILKDEMTRAPLITTTSPRVAGQLAAYITNHFKELKNVAESSTRFGKLKSLEPLVHEKDLYLRIGMFCGDAAGHNMVENAAIVLSNYLENLQEFKGNVSLLSVSSNYCTDKKPSLANLEKGRGKRVLARAIIPRDVVQEKLKTLPEQIAELNYKKNIIGSQLAGAVGGGNSHYANIVSAVFIATGQDIANNVEASMGYTLASCTEKGDLCFSVEISCLIVGTIGGGTNLPYARVNLEKMRCYGSGNPPGNNAKKFAEIISAAVFAGELSTMAELTKAGKFIESHFKYERNRKDKDEE